MEILAVLNDPDKHATPIPLDKLVADDKVYRKGVERYKRIIEEGGEIGTIVVVRHPTKDLYAVLDGHHRFWAQKELDVGPVMCAVIQDFYGLTFKMTEKGLWQPSPEFTKKVRVPLIRWGEELTRYLHQFLDDPLRVKAWFPENKETDEDLGEDDLI